MSKISENITKNVYYTYYVPYPSNYLDKQNYFLSNHMCSHWTASTIDIDLH